MAGKNSIVINLFGAPGSGKSTLAAALFADLKCLGLNCELVTEYAKDLTWAKRSAELKIQPYIFGKQLLRIERVINQVDIIITDSPLLLSLIYTNDEWPDTYKLAVKDIFNQYKNYNFLLKRRDDYQIIGRNQSEDEAANLALQIKQLFFTYNIKYTQLNNILLPDMIKEIKSLTPLTSTG